MKLWLLLHQKCPPSARYGDSCLSFQHLGGRGKRIMSSRASLGYKTRSLKEKKKRNELFEIRIPFWKSEE
jgi:hypothetical protein